MGIRITNCVLSITVPITSSKVGSASSKRMLQSM
jgi:hypothetical protein